ncbi:MAG: hypothetical protein ABSA34_04565 [Candidatus Goldiibacteriota bacterium]
MFNTIKKEALLLFFILLGAAGIYAAGDCALILYSGAEAEKASLTGGGSLTALTGTAYSVDCSGGTATVKLSKGGVFIKAGAEELKVKVSGAEIGAKQSIFFTNGSVIDVYGGYVTALLKKKKIRIPAGGRYDISAMKRAGFPENPEKFPGDCLQNEKYSSFIQCAISPEYYGTARNIFSGMGAISREIGKVYFSFDTSSPVRDIDVTMTVKTGGAAGLELTGAARNAATGDLIGSISSYRKVSGTASPQEMQALLADAASQLSVEIANYDAVVSVSGAVILVEAEGFDKGEYGELNALLGRLKGVISIKYDEYYGQKAVYTIKYRGFGADMAEAIKALKLKKSHINIWNYSKFVVKLNNKQAQF